jgi:hypothetical protein
VPASGTNLLLTEVVPAGTRSPQAGEPGRWTCTSKTNQAGTWPAHHVTVKVVAVEPVLGLATSGIETDAAWPAAPSSTGYTPAARNRNE